ncbi:hypothetical protein BSKO_01209 [Bryopsis sp. KO-2023]|nr:hypothetical protein BSKO_01209 [Bryopsis sp. KO-2023]
MSHFQRLGRLSRHNVSSNSLENASEQLSLAACHTRTLDQRRSIASREAQGNLLATVKHTPWRYDRCERRNDLWRGQGGAGLCTTAPATTASPPDRHPEFVDFRNLNTWEQVKEKVDKLGAKASPFHITAAFNRLKQILDTSHAPRDFLMDLSSRAMAFDDVLKPREIVDVVHACAKLKFTNGVLLEHLAGLVVGSKECSVDKLGSRNLSVLLYALGSHSRYGDRQIFLKGKGNQLVNAVMAQIRSTEQILWESRQLAQALYGVALLEWQDPMVARKILAGFADPKVLQGCSESDLCSVVFSMAELKLKDKNMVDLIMNEVGREVRVKELQKFGVASVIQNLGRLGCRKYDLMEKLCNAALAFDQGSTVSSKELAQIVHGLGIMEMTGISVLGKLGEECTNPKRIKEFAERELANLVYGFGKLRHITPEMAAVLGKEVSKRTRLPAFTDQGLSTIIYGLSLCKIQDEKLVHALAKEVVKKKRLENFTSQAICNILQGLGKLQGLKEETLNAVMKEIVKEERLPNFSSQGLSTIIYTLSQVNFNNIRVLDKVVAECIKPDRISTFKAQGISNLFSGLTHMGVTDKMVWQILSIEASKPSRLTSFTEQGLIQIVHALKRSRFHSDELLCAIGKEILVPERLGDYSEESLAGAFVILAQSDFAWRWMDNRSVSNVLKEVSKPSRLNKFSERGLCSVLKAMRLLNLKGGNVMGLLTRELMSDGKFGSVHEKGLCSVLVSLSKMGFKERDVYARICDRLLEEPMLSKLNPLHFVNIVDSLHFSEFGPDERVEKFLERVVSDEVLSACTENDLVVLLRGFGNLRVSNKDTVMVLLDAVTEPEKVSKLSAKQVAFVLEACLDLGFTDQERIEKLFDEETMLVAKAGVHHLVKITINLCKLGSIFDRFTSKLVEELSKPDRLEAITDVDLASVIGQLTVAGISGIEDLDDEKNRRKSAGKIGKDVADKYNSVRKVKGSELAKDLVDLVGKDEKGVAVSFA